VSVEGAVTVTPLPHALIKTPSTISVSIDVRSFKNFGHLVPQVRKNFVFMAYLLSPTISILSCSVTHRLTRFGSRLEAEDSGTGYNLNMTQNIIATIITLALSLTWLRLMDALAHRGVIDQKLSRKIIHIGTGPLFVLCWLMFNDEPAARYLAALVPLLITVQFILVGAGVIKDEAAVKAMTRTGNPREILRGPLYYGVVFVVCTILFWRNSPVGILALMMMCGGDGLADVIGRRFGAIKIPFNKEKSFAGSAAMFVRRRLFVCFHLCRRVQRLGIFLSASLLPFSLIRHCHHRCCRRPRRVVSVPRY
jgi:phytol kinase